MRFGFKKNFVDFGNGVVFMRGGVLVWKESMVLDVLLFGRGCWIDLRIVFVVGVIG